MLDELSALARTLVDEFNTQAAAGYARIGEGTGVSLTVTAASPPTAYIP